MAGAAPKLKPDVAVPVGWDEAGAPPKEEPKPPPDVEEPKLNAIGARVLQNFFGGFPAASARTQPR